MTTDPDFFKSIYQKHITEKAYKHWITFYVSIGSSKEPTQFEFNLNSPTLEYQQHGCKSCCFSSLASAFVVSQ